LAWYQFRAADNEYGEQKPERVAACILEQFQPSVAFEFLRMVRWFKDRLWPLAWRTVREWNGDDGGLLAASLAFYTAFSFFPLLLVLLSIFGFVLRFSAEAQQVQAELIDVVAQQASPALAQQLSRVMAEIQESAVVGGPLGLATLLFGAIGIFANMEVAFHRIWKTRDLPGEHKGWLHTVREVLFVRFKAFLVVLSLGLFIVATFFTGIVLSALRTYAGDFPYDERFWGVVQFAIGFALDGVFFTVTYWLFSVRKTKWFECLVGGLLASFFWELGRLALTQFLLRGGYNAYGVIGSFIAMMLWFYYAWTVLFFGAEFVQVTHRMSAARHAAHSTVAKTAATEPVK
jgi:membrane protein